MWLLLDIGNSSAKVGLYDPTSITDSRGVGELMQSFRIEHSVDATPQLKEVVRDHAIGRVGGVSVVPSQSQMWTDLVRRACQVELEFYDEQSALPILLTYDTPRTLGNDRIAAAVAGWTRYGRRGECGVVVIDAGTAINYEVVTAAGEYPGGAIAPGPELMRQALGLGTAQLPAVDLVMPSSRIGRSTAEALQSGIMNGMLDSVRVMASNLTRDDREPMEVVLSGGWGAWLSEKTGFVYEEGLVLKGVADLMRFAVE